MNNAVCIYKENQNKGVNFVPQKRHPPIYIYLYIQTKEEEEEEYNERIKMEFYTQRMRRQNLESLKTAIIRLRKEKGYIYVNAAIFTSSVAHQLGVTTRKIEEYLKEIQAEGYISIYQDENSIYFMKRCDDEITFE